MFHILALCAGNASRSILAEAILNRDGLGRVRAWSAGTNPKGMVNGNVLDLLDRRGADIHGLRSKGWAEFVAPGAPEAHLVLRLCPTVSQTLHPDWPGDPLQADWHLDDPEASPPDQAPLACQHAYHRLSMRINALLSLPFERMSRTALAARLSEIGER